MPEGQKVFATEYRVPVRAQGKGPRYTNPGLQAEKKKPSSYKKTIAMPDCIVIMYPA